MLLSRGGDGEGSGLKYHNSEGKESTMASDDIIGMADMTAIFGVTDDYGVDREQISVPLEKEDPGRVTKLPSGEVEIVVPLTVPIDQWLDTLRTRLEVLGYTLVDEDE